jgi:hypothetical protein
MAGPLGPLEEAMLCVLPAILRCVACDRTETAMEKDIDWRRPPFRYPYAEDHWLCHHRKSQPYMLCDRKGTEQCHIRSKGTRTRA